MFVFRGLPWVKKESDVKKQNKREQTAWKTLMLQQCKDQKKKQKKKQYPEINLQH